jgi:hypothetical protein
MALIRNLVDWRRLRDTGQQDVVDSRTVLYTHTFSPRVRSFCMVLPGRRHLVLHEILRPHSQLRPNITRKHSLHTVQDVPARVNRDQRRPTLVACFPVNAATTDSEIGLTSQSERLECCHGADAGSTAFPLG